jgi:DNA-binding transcriptional regulator YiaG
MKHEQEAATGHDRQTIRRKDGRQLSDGAQLARQRISSRRREETLSGRGVLGSARDSTKDGAPKARPEAKEERDKSKIDISSLPSVLIPYRDSLPEVGGIYFVLEKSEVMYIGKSQNLRKRWHGHECCAELDRPKKARVAWLEVPSEEDRTRLEQSLIARLNPRLNIKLRLVIKPETYRLVKAAMTGEELKDRREKLGLSRTALAEELRTTLATITRWENGDRSIPAYLDLALETVERNHKPTKKKGNK